MRVLLIWPRNERSVLSDELSCAEPLPLEYLAGALRSHHDVHIHDLRLDPPLESLAGGEAPDLVGLAIPYTTIVRAVHEIAADVRRLWPDVPIVVGGHHPTMSGEWLDGLPADYIVVGEGAAPLKALVAQLEKHGDLVEPIPSAGRFAERAHLRYQPDLETLDSMPFPDRSPVARHRESYFHSVYRPVVLMRFSAGCPYKCNFCSLWRMTDRRYLTKDVPRVLAELEAVQGDSIYVVDDEAFIQPRRMSLLADAIEESGIRKKYHMYVRADTALRNPEVITRWAEIGLDSVLVGAESMSDAELDEYEKGAHASETRGAVDLFHSLGVKVRTNFIIKPEYQLHDFDRVARTVEELGIDMPSFSVLTPLPGTVLYEQTRDQLISDNPDLYDCYHSLYPTKMPESHFYRAFADLLERTAQRQRPGLNDQDDPSVFYFSSGGAFGRMLEAVRQGHLLSQQGWRSGPVSGAGMV
ncbi:MAG: radical SAM protein [Acidobacteriota bacterium]|nr:radical SAM protein [Acidobacteriota bacterium]